MHCWRFLDRAEILSSVLVSIQRDGDLVHFAGTQISQARKRAFNCICAPISIFCSRGNNHTWFLEYPTSQLRLPNDVPLQ
jgi:hypothetical protein